MLNDYKFSSNETVQINNIQTKAFGHTATELFRKCLDISR